MSRLVLTKHFLNQAGGHDGCILHGQRKVTNKHTGVDLSLNNPIVTCLDVALIQEAGHNG
eukprot:8385677-Ditylum_brightwellii.AAC.2